MPSINQYGYSKFNNARIVLSEECYKRLLGDINLTGYNMGFNENEYGTMLYGTLKQDSKGNYIFHFITPSEVDDYTPESKQTKLMTSAMSDELIKNTMVENAPYNCVAHIHTHPYINEGTRFLSQEDVQSYTTMFTNWSNIAKQQGNQLYTFGGLLTISKNNVAEEDDISFLHYDVDSGQFHQIPNVSILTNDKEISLQNVGDTTLVSNNNHTR